MTRVSGSMGTQLGTYVTAVDGAGLVALGVSQSAVLPRHLLSELELQKQKQHFPPLQFTRLNTPLNEALQKRYRNATETL